MVMLKSPLFDVHSHLNFAAFDKDRAAVLERMKERGILSVVVGTDKKTSAEAAALAGKYPFLFASAGLHPTDSAEDFDYDYYKNLVQNPRVVAVGECGLDFFHLKKDEDKARQEKKFKKQIKLALEFDKPLIIHCRDARPPSPSDGFGGQAYNEVLEILRDYPNVRGNMHFFAGDWLTAQKFLDFGFYLSFTGVITFAKQYDEILEKMPLNRLMIETDAPFVAPAPHRGQRNEPVYVEETAKKIAVLRGISFEKIAAATVQNAKKFFDIS